MISIVVCSAKEERFNQFSESVASSIGLPYEIIRIDNSKNEYSLCQAYNKGKAQCNYEIICFSHDDVLFLTQNWGSVLVDVLKDPQIGLVGVFGICFYSMFPQGFSDLNEIEGQLKVGAMEGAPVRKHVRFSPDAICEVAGIDGLFMVTRKDVIDRYRFSEDILHGFHGYDVDINMQIRQHYKIVITRDILMYHHSGGTFNEAFYDAMKILSVKWKGHFPVYVPFYTKKEIRKLHLRSLQEYHKRVISKKRSFKNYMVAFRYAQKQRVFFPWLKQTLQKS
jgi:hypothetical protein